MSSPGERGAVSAATRVLAERGWPAVPSPAAEPALVILFGLPGTGKSHLAAAIAAQLPVVTVRTDEVRKILYRTPTYSPAESGFVYLTCYELVRRLLAGGHAVVFDATNLSRSSRRQARAIARQMGVPALAVQTIAPPDVVAERLAVREAGGAETYASDAGWEVHQKLAPALESGGGETALVVDTSETIEPALSAILTFLRAAPCTRPAVASMEH